MNRKVGFTLGLLFFILVGLGSASVKAQDWSPAQKEVWKNVTDYWALLAKGDVSGFLDYIHKDYLGWDNDSELPGTKEESQKWLEYMMQGTKFPVYELKPLGIKVYGDVAFVHYDYSLVREKDGKKNMEKGRWTDIMMKQGSKWVMIGDHGGSVKKED
jgi:ketosteroid isomerase-like protein